MGEGETDGLVWTLDTGHFPDPVTRWSSHLYTKTQTAIIAGLMAETGALLDSVASRELDGRVYTALVPLGGRVRPPSPRWLVPILCRTTPLLRQRLAAAHAADVTDWSGQVVADWYGGKEDELLERGRGFLAGDLTALTSAQVATRLEEQLRFVEDSLAWHFRLHVAGADAIGRLGLDLTEQHGWSALEVMDLFTGLSAATTDPAEAQRAITERVREAGAIDALDAADTLADVAATSRSVAAALQAYQDRWGQRAVRYEVAHPTIVERPEWLLRQLKAAARAPAGTTDLAARHEAARTRAEARLIATLGNSSFTRRRLVRAQRAFPLRDGNETATIGIPIAGLRRLGLHISERLGLHRPEDAFDLTFDEVVEALRHPERGSGAASLALPRREERERLAAKAAPPMLGRPAGAPAPNPDLRGYPRAPAEQLAALLWYFEQISGPPSRAASVDQAVRGLGVSPGIYEGTARVIRDEDDFEHLEPGDVMVCPNTSPVWSVVLPCIGALVCDGGGALSHPAIAARELAIPAVVATGNATATIIDGTRVRVDGKSGEVALLS